jgi:hypothetical protein
MIGLFQLHIVGDILAEGYTLIVIVDGYGENLLGLLLSHNVLIEILFDLVRCGDVFKKFVGKDILFFVQDLLADVYALIADVNSRSGDQPACDVGALPAERADLLPLISCHSCHSFL